ncbi:hypothetical protein F4X33_20725 [Candidatus Poribacteria bacterium]|nr:hypothetical protein [Candidatus Poribacteria bacterium]
MIEGQKSDALDLPHFILLRIATYGFNATSEGLGIVLLEGIQTEHVERLHDVEGQRTKLMLPFDLALSPSWQFC